MGQNRCLIVDSKKIDPEGPKDANEALVSGTDVLELIRCSETLTDSNVIKVSDIRKQLLFRINNEKMFAGMPSKSLNFFNK